MPVGSPLYDTSKRFLPRFRQNIILPTIYLLTPFLLDGLGLTSTFVTLWPLFKPLAIPVAVMISVIRNKGIASVSPPLFG